MTIPPDQTSEQSPTQEVTIDQAAIIMGKSASTVRRMIKRGELETVKATTPTGFVYRIRLPVEDASPPPTQAINAQNRRGEALEGILAAFSDRLATLVEENARQTSTIKEQAEEIGRLRMEVAYVRRSLWQRFKDLVQP